LAGVLHITQFAAALIDQSIDAIAKDAALGHNDRFDALAHHRLHRIGAIMCHQTTNPASFIQRFAFDYIKTRELFAFVASI
jgi:hypothetical protein